MENNSDFFLAAITPGFSDPSEIFLICWFGAQETFVIIIDVENGCAAYIFVETEIFCNVSL